jgi:hypothetical protein
MRILFVCGSLEPVNDGVGDYTRRLCGELVRTEIDAQIISLCNLKVICLTSQNQFIEEKHVGVYRIPMAPSNDQRFICL